MTSEAFSLSLFGCLTRRLCVKMSSHMKISYCWMRQFLPITTPYFIFTFKAAALLCLSHQVSLVQTEYISCRLIFLPLHFLNNNSLNLMSSLISVYSPHTCFVKSEKLIEVNEGKKAPSCHFIVTNPHTHTHTCTHAQTNITLVATRVLCCITDRAQKRLYRDIWMLHSCHEGLSCGATFY